jgi:hypothetical protein
VAKEDVAKEDDITKLAPMDEYNLIAVFLRGIRSQCLRRHVTLWFHLFYSDNTPLHKTVASRLSKKKLPATRCNLACELKPGEVMKVIGCSRRTAFDYIRALQSTNL